ncbi:MAG TPA: translation factor GTPase family protein, partial [Candidatus Limnocylindria bacterium]
TQTDSLDLERERGITIRSAVAAFQLFDLAVNLVDTPGHPDFIAEVERVLGVLDGAILVVSAVEGVQPQTPLLFRALQRLGVPSLIFVNKIDRPGADPDAVLAALRRRLAAGVVAMGAVHEPGTPTATIEAATLDIEPTRSAVTELLANNDDAVLNAFVRGDGLSVDVTWRALIDQTGRGLVHPVFFGSAARGIGIGELMRGIDQLLPAANGDLDAPVSGRVFKIERAASGERVAYVRIFAGSLRARQRVRVGGADEVKPTSVRAFAPAGLPRRDTATPGEMAAVRGLGEVRIGDAIGVPPPGSESRAHFPRPALEAVVIPRRAEESGSLRAALAQLAEQDPLINVRQDDHRNEISVSLYGDVQKEVIGATLERDYGIAVEFRETTVVCIERPAKVAEAEELLSAPTKTNITGRSSPLSTNPFRATLALRVEPAPPGSGVLVTLDVDPRLVPLYIFRTPEAFATHMEAFVREALTEGLAGWEVTDCVVTVSDCGYGAPATTAADFRRLTELVTANALARAGTWVCEPLAQLNLEMPSSTAHAVLAVLSRMGARVTGQFSAGGVSRIGAVLPVARVRTLQHRLPGLTMGEGILEALPGGYQPVGENPPMRPRARQSPLDRDAWIASLTRRG